MVLPIPAFRKDRVGDVESLFAMVRQRRHPIKRRLGHNPNPDTPLVYRANADDSWLTAGVPA